MDKHIEDQIVARAAELYREWEARPWHVKVTGWMRTQWRALRFRLRLY